MKDSTAPCSTFAFVCRDCTHTSKAKKPLLELFSPPAELPSDAWMLRGRSSTHAPRLGSAGRSVLYAVSVL